MPIINPNQYWCWENSLFSKVLIAGVMVFEYVFIMHIFREILMMMLDILEQQRHQLQLQ